MTADPRHAQVVVELLDTETGRRVSSAARAFRFGASWWAEGNGGCDCNRVLLFDPDAFDGEDETGHCRGEKRYLVVGVAGPGAGAYPLRAYNRGYPPALLDQYLPSSGPA